MEEELCVFNAALDLTGLGVGPMGPATPCIWHIAVRSTLLVAIDAAPDVSKRPGHKKQALVGPVQGAHALLI